MADRAGSGSGDASLGPLAALVQAPASSAVITDFDGTLSAIVGDPDKAVALEGARRCWRDWREPSPLWPWSRVAP